MSHFRPSHRYRVAFLSSLDPADRRSWSGIPYFMSRAIEESCGPVVSLGPFRPVSWTVGRIASKVSRLFAGPSIDYQHTHALARAYGAYFSERLRALECDVVFAPAAASELAYLETDRPVISASDATFHLLQEYYSFYGRLASWSARTADAIERRALHKAAAVIYPTSWPVASAVHHYGVDAARVHVIPYGANIDTPPSREEILRKTNGDRCRLLFLGVEWERKGGDIAFETLVSLERSGIDAELTVVGCTPPAGVRHRRLSVIPFLDKNDPAQRIRFNDLLFNTDLLLLPTRAEAYGIVFCEASAFGIPSISTDTGGVAGVVTEGTNGHLLPLRSRGEDYARLIAELVRDSTRYARLRISSRAQYEALLNWSAWGRSIRTVMDDLI